MRAIAERQAQIACNGKTHSNTALTELLRCLNVVTVLVPYAHLISAKWRVSPRLSRELPRFFGLIQASAALNQYRRHKQGFTLANGGILANSEDYAFALSAINEFTQGELAGLTGPSLDIFRAVCTASAKRQNEPVSTWQETTDNFDGKLVPRRQPKPDEALKGWCSTNDIIAEYTGALSNVSVYENLANMRGRGLFEFKNQLGVVGSDKGIWLYKPIEMSVLDLPKTQEIHSFQLNQLKQLK